VNVSTPPGISHVWPVIPIKAKGFFQHFFFYIKDECIIVSRQSQGIPGNGK
jgi:hypothetical protein